MDIRRWMLFAVSSVPTFLLLTDSDPINPSGQWAVIFLLLTTLVAVGQKILKTPALKYRRQLGLWAMWYTMFHVSHYFLETGISGYLREWSYDYQLIGMFAVVGLGTLTATSTKWAQRKLRANWSVIHKSMYVIIGLALIHGVIATKLGWFTMWPFAAAAVIIFMFKKSSAQYLAIFGVVLAYSLASIPEPTAPTGALDLGGVRTCELGPPNQCDIEDEVNEPQPIERSDHVVSISCVNGKELVYYADGRRDNHANCAIDTSIYEIWDRNGFDNDLVTNGIYNGTN